MERFIHFKNVFNESAKSHERICFAVNSTNCIDPCQHWTCFNGFTFSVVLLVNLSES